MSAGEIEIAAAILGVINVVLVVRRSTVNYPFGIASVALYFFVFWQAKLYSDALLQIFFVLIQLYGWWAWVHARQVDHGVAVGWMPWPARTAWMVATGIAILIWGTAMARFTDAAAPFVDATTAGLSVAAQSLQSLRRVESWLLWITVDLIAIGLFAWRDLFVTSGLYAIFLILASIGLFEWRRKASA
ncbi:MAG TPA: nicotinamide riboside transporter PnuC [Sphingomicrobium sp.]